MTPNGGGKPEGKLLQAIEGNFGSYDSFVAQFKAAAGAVEGSGWALLVKNRMTGRLEILTSEKHQNLSQWVVEPLLIVDVWEHAYYLKYQNKRPDYVNAFFNVINWKDVQSRFEK